VENFGWNFSAKAYSEPESIALSSTVHVTAAHNVQCVALGVARALDVAWAPRPRNDSTKCAVERQPLAAPAAESSFRQPSWGRHAERSHSSGGAKHLACVAKVLRRRGNQTLHPPLGATAPRHLYSSFAL